MTASTDVTSDAHRTPTTEPGTGAVPAGVVVPFPSRRSDAAGEAPGEAFTIDCAECAHRRTDVCGDCVVSFIVEREPEDALVVDADEARAVRLLERAGLVPGVRHEARASGA